MRAFVAISLIGFLLIGPVGEFVSGAIEAGYRMREANTRMAVSVVQSSAGGAEVVPMDEYAAQREER